MDAPPLAEPVYVDRAMWEKIVLNLLSNALKFTFTGEIRVSLGVAPDGAGAELRVADTGTGIPPDELPHLFERFHRVRGARRAATRARGIGLALVHDLAALHGGSVDGGERARPGQHLHRAAAARHGAPAGRAASTPPPARPRATRPSRRTVKRRATGCRAVAARRRAGRRTGDAAGAQRAETARRRVLVADDNADLRAYIARLLADRYAVETVADGAAALQAVARELPDLVLTDVMMPVLDGFELLRALRADERTARVPVIMLSARAGEESAIEGLAGRRGRLPGQAVRGATSCARGPRPTSRWRTCAPPRPAATARASASCAS